MSFVSVYVSGVGKCRTTAHTHDMFSSHAKNVFLPSLQNLSQSCRMPGRQNIHVPEACWCLSPGRQVQWRCHAGKACHAGGDGMPPALIRIPGEVCGEKERHM